MDSLEGSPRPLLDPNTWSKDGTVALAGVVPSEDGKHLAYGVAEAGSDWTTWRVLDIQSAKRIEEITDDWAFLVKNLGMKLP
jgi:prolyl oligopeptidase